MAVRITGVDARSAAEKAGICAGETLVSMNGHEIADILDFRFYETEANLHLLLCSEQGEERTVSLRKRQYDSIGLQFETYLMDRQRSCRNRCIFCFIDQLPKGMRKSLYFKDDDSRLSFLFGNYITLTNLSEREVERILHMHISPINVSVHTTNPELRCKMMGNRFAGQCLSILKRLAEGGIHLNCQLVLCPGINDGEELQRTLDDLYALGENLQSIACVPVGVTRYREGLYPLTTYTRETAAVVIDQVEAYGDHFCRTRGARTVYVSDEFYLLAGRELPGEDFYEDIAQLENCVGLLTSLKSEFEDALFTLTEEEKGKKRRLTLVTGEGAYPFLNRLLDELREKCDNYKIRVIPVKNDFFGGTVNVAGLLTGQDIERCLQREDLGECVLLPGVTLRQQEDVFLDDMSLQQLAGRLGVPVIPVPNSGYALLDAIIGRNEEIG